MSSLRLSELIDALGFAIDIGESQTKARGARSCLVGMRIGRALDLPEESLGELYYTLQLKDLGRSTRAQGAFASHDTPRARCRRAASIARRLELGGWVVASIQAVEARWDGTGEPAIAGEQIPLYSRIASIAEVAELFHTAAGPLAALEEVRSRSGTWLDPSLVGVLERLGPEDPVWRTLDSTDVTEALVAEEPTRLERGLDERYLDQIAAAFVELLETCSPATAEHSSRVAFYTDLVATELGIGPERRRWLRRGALLHDLGKIGVERALLEKPAELGPTEREVVERHASYTEQILARIPAFAELARVAGGHHERLDGTGYPRGLNGDAIPLETRIITTADIFDALSSKRPYRAAGSFEETLDVMSMIVGTRLDKECFTALVSVVEELEYAAMPTIRVAA